jgi:hypothetical protein
MAIVGPFGNVPEIFVQVSPALTDLKTLLPAA